MGLIRSGGHGRFKSAEFQGTDATSDVAEPEWQLHPQMLKVMMPGKDQQVVVHATPGQKIEINGADPSKLAINILGADVIMSDPLTNAKIVFLGLGLILFSPEHPRFFSVMWSLCRRTS